MPNQIEITEETGRMKTLNKSDFKPEAHRSCPCCGSINYHKFSDLERLEPDEESCDDCGLLWQEWGKQRRIPEDFGDERREQLLYVAKFWQSPSGGGELVRRLKIMEKYAKTGEVEDE